MPALGSQPCSCNGSNENCVRCNGSGYVPVRRNSLVVESYGTPCPRCGMRISGFLNREHAKSCRGQQVVERLVDHRSKGLYSPGFIERKSEVVAAQPEILISKTKFAPHKPLAMPVPPFLISEVDKSMTKTGSRKPLPWVCPLCLAHLGRPYIERKAAYRQYILHLKQKHGLTIPDAQRQALEAGHEMRRHALQNSGDLTSVVTKPTEHFQQGNSSKSNQRVRSRAELTRCGSCDVLVRCDRLEKHKRRVHGPPKRRDPGQQLASAISPDWLVKSTGVKGFDANLERKQNRRLDGSRDYWLIREDGRFGSHPSFDSCDDESGP